MKKRVLSMVLALSMMLTLFPVSAFADGTGNIPSADAVAPQAIDIGSNKQTPPDDAYQISSAWYGPVTELMGQDLYSFEDYQRYGFDTEFSVGKRNPSDYTDYGSASIHYYHENATHDGPDFNNEVNMTPRPPLGVTYYAVAQTAGNDQYEAKVYTSSAVKFSFNKLTPYANPSYYTPKLNGVTLDGAQTISTNALATATVTVDKSDATVNDASNIRYAPVPPYSSASIAEATSDLSALTPGTYQIVFDMAESDYYASYPNLTYSQWRFTVEDSREAPTAGLYTVKLNGKTLNGSQKLPFTALATATVTVEKDDAAGKASNVRYAPVLNGKVWTNYAITDLAALEVGTTYQVVLDTEPTGTYSASSELTSPAWRFTVSQLAPTADLYTVQLNGEVLNGQTIPYSENPTFTVTAIPAAGAGAATIYYAMFDEDDKPDTDNMTQVAIAPGTYQVYLDVAEGTGYDKSDEKLTKTEWHFTIDHDTLTPDKFHYDSKTGKFDKLPYGVTENNITVTYYNGTTPVTDLVEKDGVKVPRLAGTYHIGITVPETSLYKAYDSHGPVDAWTYEKEKNIPAFTDFDVISAPAAENAYTGQPVTEAKVEAHDDIKPVDFKIGYYNKDTKQSSYTAPKDTGSYSWFIEIAGDDNTIKTSITPSNSDFVITGKTGLTTDEITVTVPDVTEGDDKDFRVTFASKDESILATDDLEITYYDANGALLTELPRKAGTYTYHITVKAGSAAEKNFGEGAFLSGTYTIYSTGPSISGGELKPTDPDAKLAPGVDVTITANPDTDTDVFQSWTITVDGVEVEPTKEDLKAKLGVDVEDDDAAAAWFKTRSVSFKLPAGKLNIFTLTSNPQQESFDKAVGTALVVTGAAAATGAVYFFGTTAYIRSVLPEGVAIPQNREQLAVALWSLAGKPTVESTAVFTDVPADSEALPAIRWAVETGVLSANTTEDGTSFQTGSYVTRIETAIRLFKLQKQLAR